MVHVDAPPDLSQGLGVGRVLQVGLRAHQLQEAAEARGAVGEELREGCKPPDRVYKGGDIKAEGDEVHGVQLPSHDKEAAHGNDRRREEAEEKLHHGIEAAHGLVELPLGGLVDIVGGVEFLQLLRLVGKGLCGAHPGDAGLHPGVDDGGLLLHLAGGLAHGAAAAPDHQEEHRQDGGDDESQPPLDAEHDDKGPHDGDAGDKNVLRSVVGQLRNLKELAGEAAHEGAGTVAVKVPEVQLLHVPEEVPADIGLHQDTKGVAPVADDILHPRPQSEGQQHDGHDREEGPVGVLRQQLIHAPAGDVGEGQVDQGDAEGAGKIQEKELPMGAEVREEDPQAGLLPELTGGHSLDAPLR